MLLKLCGFGKKVVGDRSRQSDIVAIYDECNGRSYHFNSTTQGSCSILSEDKSIRTDGEDRSIFVRNRLIPHVHLSRNSQALCCFSLFNEQTPKRIRMVVRK